MIVRFPLPKASTSVVTKRFQPQSASITEEAPLNFLNLPGLQINSVEENEFNIWVNAQQSPKLQNCPKCGCQDERFKRNGTRPQIYRDEPHGLRSVHLEIHRQSYYCRQCQKPSQHPLLFVDDKWRMTSRLVTHIRKLSLLRPNREVALLTGASPKTVREIAVEYRKQLEKTVRFETPRVLGVDGVHVRVKNERRKRSEKKPPSNNPKHKQKKSRKKECAIITDIEAGTVVEMWPSITIPELTKKLRALPDRERVKIVVIDMSPALFKAVRTAFPNAIIIIDLFHVQRKINDGIDNVRKRLRKSSPRTKGQLTMCRRELLRKRHEQLSPHEKEELKRWFDLKPELRLAYETKETCLEIWHSSTSKSARERYRRWLNQFPLELREDFKSLLTAMRNWEEFILNFFDYRYTNAFTESSNRLVKDIQRETRSCGFETLRARVIYGTLLKRQMEEARRTVLNRKKRKPQSQRARKIRRGRAGSAQVVSESRSAMKATLGHSQLPALQMDLF